MARVIKVSSRYRIARNFQGRKLSQNLRCRHHCISILGLESTIHFITHAQHEHTHDVGCFNIYIFGFNVHVGNRLLSFFCRFIHSSPAEYDPNKHCGVWISESKKHCTHSLTCKVHTTMFYMCVKFYTLYTITVTTVKGL